MPLRLSKTKAAFLILLPLIGALTACKTQLAPYHAVSSLNFQCDSNFSFYNQMWADKNINKIYDSLNRINFSEQDFEMRIWYYCAGQLGIANNAFVLKHYAKGNYWKAFYYKGFKDDNTTHKTANEFFSNSELIKFKSNEWAMFYDTLVTNHILTLNYPSHESLSKLLNGDRLNTSHNCYYTFELIKKDCKRRYTFDTTTPSIQNFEQIPEFKSFHTLIRLMSAKVNNN